MVKIEALKQAFAPFKAAVTEYNTAYTNNDFELMRDLTIKVEQSHLAFDRLYQILEQSIKNITPDTKNINIPEIRGLISDYRTQRRNLINIANEILETTELCDKGTITPEFIKTTMPRSIEKIRSDANSLLGFH